MYNQQFETNDTINAWDVIEQNCSQLLPLPSAVIFAAHEQSKAALLEEQAELDSHAIQLNTDMLNAVAGLKALEDRKESNPVSFIQLLQNIRTRGKPDDTQ